MVDITQNRTISISLSLSININNIIKNKKINDIIQLVLPLYMDMTFSIEI